MRKILSVVTLVLLSQSAFAERFVLRVGDLEYQGSNVIRIKEMLRQQYNIVPQDYELTGVSVLSKTRHGRGTAALKVGQWVSNPQRIYGTPEYFDSRDPRTFYETYFYNDNLYEQGVWQLVLEGNHKVRRIVVDAHLRRGPPGPGPGPGPRPPGPGPRPPGPPPHHPPGPGPGPGYDVQYVECGSWNNNTMFCEPPYGGTPVTARVVRQQSNSPCIFGQTFGLYDRGVWVSGGCRASFEVQTQRRFR